MEMKNPRFILSTVIILGLAVFGFSQWQKVAELNQQIAQLRAEAAAQTAGAQEEVARLQRQIEDRTAVINQMEEQRKTIASHEATAEGAPAEEGAKAKAPASDFGSVMKKMFTDPSSKKMMRNMQMMGVKMMYADLAKELGLKPEQANLVMELLGDRQMALTTKGMKMMGGDAGEAASVDEVGRDAAATNEDYDAQLENILGKDGMAQLTEFEKSVGDRMQLAQYQQAFVASGLPLDENESRGLLNIMKEERAKQAPSPLDPGAKDVGAAMKAMQSEETYHKLMADREAVDQRVLAKARVVLSPDKMVQFQTIQTQTAETMKSQIDLARGLLNPPK